MALFALALFSVAFCWVNGASHECSSAHVDINGTCFSTSAGCMIEDVDGYCPDGYVPHVERCYHNVTECRAEESASAESAEEEEEHHWGYEEENGPHTWAGICQTGTRQSPIDIQTASLTCYKMAALSFGNYDATGNVTVRNNGHGFSVEGFENFAQRPHIEGGGLGARYDLVQLHLHWSENGSLGSEHTLNGLSFSSELHFVHVKEGHTLPEALEQPDGVAVVGVFYRVGSNGTSMAKLNGVVDQVLEEDQTASISDYSAGLHLPLNVQNFYRYNGSLTTPVCNEAVIWTVMEQPASITRAQLAQLRKILPKNVRPVQPLQGRTVSVRLSKC